jgi:predicted metal-dependent hydrolase
MVMAFWRLPGARPPAQRLPDHVMVGGRAVPLVVTRRAGSRTVKLRAVAATGTLQLSLPARGGVEQALALLASHQAWLAAQVAAFPPAVPLAPGSRIPFDGGSLLIAWRPGGPRSPLLAGDVLHLGGAEASVASRVQRWLVARARDELTTATLALAARIGKSVAAVTVKDTRSRWGSCTGSGRIAYSWRLILAPASVRASVVAHEVAHLVHANHGPGFHALLASLDAHAAASRRWLARHGAALHRVGAD